MTLPILILLFSEHGATTPPANTHTQLSQKLRGPLSCCSASGHPVLQTAPLQPCLSQASHGCSLP